MGEMVVNVEKEQQRNIAVDAYRGLVMLLMMAGFAYPKLRNHSPAIHWQFLAFHQSHIEWASISLEDTIQPGFTFLVGVALPYSIRSRQRRGDSFKRMLGHTIWRSFILIALGIFLRSIHSPMTNFTFEDTLTQIGLGYTFAFLLMYVRPRWQWTAFGVILFGYWLAWRPIRAGTQLRLRGRRLTPDWHKNLFAGFASHWNRNSDLGQAFDLWFLNLFPGPAVSLFNDDGYLTLSFIPRWAPCCWGLQLDVGISLLLPGFRSPVSHRRGSIDRRSACSFTSLKSVPS